MRSRLFILMLFWSLTCVGQNVTSGHIFVVRHAEKQSQTADALSPMGKARAACLAITLKDSHIKTVITSTFQRTQQTGAPTADEFKVQLKEMKADDFTAIANSAREAAKSGDVLIVGHSNTVPQIVKALANADVTVGDSDFDNLFVIDRSGLTQLHYCPASGPEPENRMR
jgi:2,3-bisphosphoglycerate-dependent phosphoglycerate mutase